MGFSPRRVATDIVRPIIFLKNTSKLYVPYYCYLYVDSAWLYGLVRIMGWFVLELETGFMDGRYLYIDIAENAVTYWDEERPEYVHTLTHKGKWYIPERVYLPSKHWDERKDRYRELKDLRDFKTFKQQEGRKGLDEFEALKEFEDFKELEDFKALKDQKEFNIDS